MKGEAQESPRHVLISEIGSLTLEFTKLSQLTGDMKYFDAVQRISDVFEKGKASPSFLACGLLLSMSRGWRSIRTTASRWGYVGFSI